jgi:hypothetical protein
MLIHGKVNRTERPPAYLLFDDILVDAMDRRTVILAVGILGVGMERFLDLTGGGWLAAMMS